MERMQPHSDVELVLPAIFHQVLVGADTSRFECFGAKLFILIRDQVDAKREVINTGLFLSQIEDANLRVRDTAAEPRLRIRLVFTVAVAKENTIRVIWVYSF